jgi:Na+/alanine symporter
MVVLFALHFGLLILVLYSIFGSYRMKQDGVITKRSEKSWNYFPIAYGIFSAIFIAIISFSDLNIVCKVFTIFIDVGTLLYLTFFNSWFRNKIITFIVKSLNKEEGS